MSNWPRQIPRLNLLQWPITRLVAHPTLLSGIRVISVVLFMMVIATGMLGEQDPTRNLAPTFIWVIWWVGLATITALCGNVWEVVNPWKILHQWTEFFSIRIAGTDRWTSLQPYPKVLGAWPGVLIFFIFAWIDLVDNQSARPARLSALVLIYSGITWSGMAVFGREVWLRYGDAFSLVFRLLSRFSITEIRVTDAQAIEACPVCRHSGATKSIDCYTCYTTAAPAQREWNLRPPATGLLQTEPLSISEMAFVLLLLATMSFDGFIATPLWVGIENTLQQGYFSDYERLGTPLIRTAGLLVFTMLFAELYIVSCVLIAHLSQRSFSAIWCARIFILTLVPIAIAYHLTHHFPYLWVQGQAVLPLLSDPFGFGWNLLGTAHYQVNTSMINWRFGGYMAITITVVGHGIAVYLALVVARRTLHHTQDAQRSLYPLLVFMVMYGTVSLWLLTQPLMETAKTNSADQATPDISPVQPPSFKRSNIPPGVTFERCLTLTPQEAVSYTFEASQPLVFDLHYHSYGLLYYALREHTVQAETLTYRPSSKPEYCLAWKNQNAQPIQLNWHYQRVTP